MLLEGKLPEKYLIFAKQICYYFNNNKKQQNISQHYWINNIDKPTIKDSLNILRNAKEIKDTISKSYPGYIIKPVHNSDEVYISVDPSLRKYSDVTLSDCHYDAPFKYIYQCNNKYIRIILALNHNDTTYTRIGNKTSLLSTLDYNGIDYNNDYHCVEGNIPDNKTRILLKLHFILIDPNSSENCVKWTEFLNDKWTHLSRELMRYSNEPKNIFQFTISYLIILFQKIYNNINIQTVLFIFIMILIFIKK